MSEQLYAIEPTKEQFEEWKKLEYRIRSLCGICQNSMIVTEKELGEHRAEVAKFIAEFQELNDQTLLLFKSVTLEEAKAFDFAGGSEEVAKIMGIEREELPF